MQCSYNHSEEHDCGNLSALNVRTEIAIIQRLLVGGGIALTGVEGSRPEGMRKAAKAVGVAGMRLPGCHRSWSRQPSRALHSSKKSPGPDGIDPLAIWCVTEWELGRVVALIRAHIRLGTHPGRWKVARGVTIPKPGKDYYSLAESYRVISLLNCLGKTAEKVAFMLASTHYEAMNGFHLAQYGCRTQRSAMDAVGVVAAQTQEA